jgi:putative ABC transport system permease protein
VIDRLRQSLQRFVSLFRRARLDQEHDAEVAAHLDLAIDENRKNGMPDEEARRQALIQLGGVAQTKENYRDHRGIAWLETLFRDLRFALRMLRKSPGFCVVAILALALGIGFSSIVFSIFYNGILNPFPYRDADRLMAISVMDDRNATRQFRPVFHLDEIIAFRSQNHTFEDIVGVSSWDVLYSRKGITELVHGCVMTPNATEFYGVPPMLGRGLMERDAQPGADPVVLLGYEYWKKEFQQDKSVVGKTMMIDNQARTVIGVMPPRFYLFGADFYALISWDRTEPSMADAMANNAPYFFFPTGIIRKAISRETANADLLAIAQRLVPLHKDDYPEKFHINTRGFSDAIVGDFKQTMFFLIGAVALLLLISSSNVASLLLTHHSARAKEIALRSALGASRGRLIRQLLLESFVLGAVGCLAGSFLAYWGLKAAKTLDAAMQIPGESDISLNWQVLLFAVAVSLLTALLFGLSPAFFAVRKDLRENLQSSGVNANSSQRGGKIRAGLVVGQVALSVLLLVFAGLVIRSFIAITNFDPGISTKNMFVADIHFPGHQYDSAESKRAYFEPALARISAIPGVVNAATAIAFPIEGGAGTDDVTIPGKPHDKHWTTSFEACSEGYFQTLGLRLLRGRSISSSDVAAARRIAVVNQTLSDQYFPNQNPIGQQIKFNVLDQIPGTPRDAYFEIVGIVSDFRNVGLQQSVQPQAFVPYTFSGFGDRAILIRTAANPNLFVNTFRQVLGNVDPNPIVSHPDTLEGLLHTHEYVKPKFRLISFGTCAGIGLGLALIGLFGVMSYSVALQTQELGVRMALGAQRSDILTLVLRKGVLLVGSGLFLGLLVAFLSVRILQSQLWGVSAFDPGAFVLAPFALLAAGLLACYLPARRATRVDPLVALRYE